MNTLKMKIVGFDELSNSLLVAFASDTTTHSDPEQYEPFAYQPITMWPDVTDTEELVRRIAVAGVYHAKAQADREAFVANPQRVAELKSLVGRELQYPVADLVPPGGGYTIASLEV